MALPGPSSSTNARDVDGGYGQGRFRGSREGIDWVPNATNRHHRVDFRYAWMPSPEMPRLPLPEAALPGIEEAEDGRGHGCRHGCQHGHGHEHGPGQQHPLGPRRARPRSSRVCGGDENQNLQNQSQNQSLNVNLNVNPNPASKRSASGSTSTGTGTSSTQASAVGHGGHCSHCSHCKRSHRSSGTLSGSGSGAPAYAYNHALQAQSHPAAGDDLPARVARVRQAPAGASASASASARAPAARPCARPRPPAREQEQESELVRRKSWLSVLSPKKLFSPRKRRSVAAAEAVTSGHTYLTNAIPTAGGDEDENEAGFYANTGATPNTNTNNAELLGRTHAAHVQVQRREVHPAEWRAYGMWARPWLGHEYGDMVVRNATPSETPRELSPPQVEEMIATLWEDEQPHPERWIPRVQHPSLPPRPELWPTPRQTHDPLPEELQLNPFLVHNLLGRPPLTFDLRLRAAEVEVGDPRLSPARYANLVPEDVPFLYPPPEAAADPPFCEGPNGAQPATYPGVSRLRITALAGDAHHVFPWPVTVLPHHAALPVLVADVVHALIANFEERLARAEFDGLSDTRRTMAYQAYWRRMRLPVAGRTPPETDGLRRVDYLGDAIWFRGLEPNKDGEGFVLFLGPPP